MVSKMVKYQDLELLDGGISSPIPIEESIAAGNKFHVIVLTRNEGYYKKPFKHTTILNRFYKKYPELIGAIMRRHEEYNRQIDLCEKLEKEGKAIIIRPKEQLTIDRASKNVKKILALYEEGIEEGKEAIPKILVKARRG
jgi:predicted patatin/cPLA2 family phospholipase